ncbi:MAG TPA: YfiR/HmsC family protein [Myxococcota bacterium]|nr:YfiR/HmsC family protein [Myxococcota bacterium]HRY92095.1 YfiR/HmsC family protein [Myxococcota bacterium]
MLPKRGEGIGAILNPRRLLPCLVLAFSLLLGAPVAIAGDAPSLSSKVKALLTAVGYHRSKAMSSKKNIVIAICYDDDTPPEVVAQARAAFEEHKRVKIGGRSFTTIDLVYKDSKSFDAELRAQGVGAVFLCEGTRKSVRQMLNVTMVVKVLSFTTDADYVHWLGVSLGVEREGKEPKLMVNLSGCKNEEVEFDSRLLRLATVFF